MTTFLFVYYLFNNDYWDNFNDDGYFGGDTWEYQSMAINWATGHGLKIGAIEDYSAYKLNESKGDSYYKKFMKAGVNSGHYSHYRTPGYPIFVGIIYKLIGMSPSAVKQVQLIMIAITCASLPVIGFTIWKTYGFFARNYFE